MSDGFWLQAQNKGTTSNNATIISCGVNNPFVFIWLMSNCFRSLSLVENAILTLQTNLKIVL